MKPVVERAFWELVRCGLWEKKPDCVYFNLLEREDWEAVYALVRKQALIGVCFPPVEALTESLRPPCDIYLKWYGQVLYIKAGSARMREAVVELEEKFGEADLHPVLMKGLGVGCWYPQPELRMTGDIDFYFPERYNEAVTLVENWGFKVTYMPGHDKIVYKGIWVEMHHQLIRFPLAEELKANTVFVPDGDVHYRIPDADANALLLLTHAAKHLIGPGVGIRHLCDWALFLRHNHFLIHFDKLWENLKFLGLERFAIEFTALACKSLELDIPQMECWCRNSDPVLERRLLDDMIGKGDCGRQSMEYRRRCNWFAYYATLAVRLVKFRVYCPGYVDRVAWQRLVGRMKFVLRGDPFGNSLKHIRKIK